MSEKKSRVFLEADKLIVNSCLSNIDQDLLLELTCFCSGLVFPKQYKCNSVCKNLSYKNLETLESKLMKRNKKRRLSEAGKE